MTTSPSVVLHLKEVTVDDRVRESISWKLTQYALGRPLGAADARIVREIHESAQKSGGTYQSLITAIATSDLVMMNRNTAFRE